MYIYSQNNLHIDCVPSRLESYTVGFQGESASAMYNFTFSIRGSARLLRRAQSAHKFDEENINI